MATRPKAVIESRNGEKFSPITITKNVLTDDGQNLHDILSDRKEDMMTPTIENSSSMFKVGQGDNVDYSSNVVNGAYESMVLKGKTMVNCVQESSSQDIVLPYEFEEGQYVTINDTKESGALGVELKGQTLVNLLNFNKMINNATTYSKEGGKITVSSISERAWASLDIFIESLKPNTDYILMIDKVSFTHSDNFIATVSVYCRDGNIKLGQLPSQDSNFFKFNTADKDLSLIALRIHATLGSANTATTVVNGLRVLEYQQGMENWDIPYFEGMASCKMPILRTTGKNLFDYSSHPITLEKLAYADGQQVYWAGYIGVKTYVPVKENTTYTYSNDINVGIHYGLVFYDGDKSVLSYINNFKTNNSFTSFTTPKGCKFIRFAMETQTIPQWIQLEEATSPTSYESYKSSILSLPEEVVLRSLPNGVCDTFNPRTGVYTQRIGEIVLNGSEVWNRAKVKTNTIVFYSTATRAYAKKFTDSRLGGTVICDEFPSSSVNLDSAPSDVEGCYTAFDGNVCIAIAKSRLTSNDVGGLKQYLQSNPTTVQYELEAPIIKKINLSSTLKSWNTTTHIYSEIPENTLYPTLTHSNPTYPVILKPSTKYSIVANSYSNNHTNSAINFNLGGATASTTVGNRVTTITTPSTLSNELLTMSGRGNKLNNVMVIEGEVVGDEPYFEGICDCKSPILSNVGKNLFNGESRVGYYTTETGIYKPIPSITQCCNITPIQVSGGTKYSFLLPEGDMKNGRTFLYDSKMNFITSIINADVRYVITTTQNTKYINFHFDNATPELFSKVQLEESSSATSYEPYKSNILSCETYFDETTQSNKTIVLRSLPNGVCDTLNVETGEYVQRIGEVMFDGSEDENWELNNTESASTKRFAIGNFLTGSNVTNDWNGANKYVCDKLNKYLWSDTVEFGITVIENSVFLYNNNIDYSIGALKTWLSQNPITIQYELATPIVSTIDVQGFPCAYTNGHMQLTSGSIEQSLTPKVEYSVVTNRNGQIRSNQKMVERHQKKLDRLQTMILTNLVNTQYEQTLTNLKYDLKNVREEVK